VAGNSQSVWMIILAVVVLLGSGAGIFFIIKTRDKE
jgi:LPXTG-motif cell wall-anchored protein